MKICMYNVTSCYVTGGLETYYWEMGRALARRGHDVTLVAGARGAAWHDEVRLVQFPFRVEQEWPNFGHRFQRLMEHLSFARYTLDHLTSAAYDAVVICKPFDFPVMWWARRRGMKAAILFHTGGTDFFFGDRWFVGAVDHLIGVSRYTARQQEVRYGRGVSIVHNGVDTACFRPMARDLKRRAGWGFPADARILVSVGRLVGWKGLRIIISVLPRLAPDVCYLVVGVGPEGAVLRAQAESLGVAGRVHFTGRIEHGDLAGVISEADLYVQPSIGEEAFGISVAEAMACGLPVLASRSGGLPEVVAEGKTGWLAPPGDELAWTNCLNDALCDSPRLRRMGDAGRKRVGEHFTWATTSAQLEQIMESGRSCAAS